MEMEVVDEDTPTSGTNIVEGKKIPIFWEGDVGSRPMTINTILTASNNG